jgi:pimeloyl-ACP methyl ester carboxylesterase
VGYPALWGSDRRVDTMPSGLMPTEEPFKAGCFMTSTTCELEVLIADQLFRVVPHQGLVPHNERAVLFVHGFRGNAEETWKSEKSDESFPSLLATDPLTSDYDIFVFQYVTNDFQAPAIDHIAAQVKFAVKQYLKYERIVLVAHSMGGLVCMSFILNLLKEGHGQSINGLLLYGVPMTGVEWAKYAQIVLQLGAFKMPFLSLLNGVLRSNRQVQALTAGSEFVDKLNGEWVLYVVNGGHPSKPTEQRAWFPVRVVTGNADWVVKESSARGNYSEIDWINVDEDHRALVKPTSRSALTYQIARDFLKDCRDWMNPEPLLKLRRQLDDMLNMRRGRCIANWQFELGFDVHECKETTNGFGLAGFRAFEVIECSYRCPLKQNFVKFGFAVGGIAANAIWSDEFVFLHTVDFDRLSAVQSDAIIQRFKAVLAAGEEGWTRLFDKILLRIRRPNETSWYQLQVGPLQHFNDRIFRPFLLPPEASHLVGAEVIISISFRGILPTAITDYTVSFPWFCDCFTVRVAVDGNPSYLADRQAMLGLPKLVVEREQQAKVAYYSKDLIFPDSYIRFEWDF